MKVLLISPLDPEVPTKLKYLMGGESTYTKMLLSNPPPGIHFAYFEDELENGCISYDLFQNVFVLLQKCRILPLGPRVQSIQLRTSYDVVYAHAYPVRLRGKKTKLIISDSSSNIIFLRDYLGWSRVRIFVTHQIKKICFKLFDIIDGEINANHAQNIFVFSQWAKKIKKEELNIKNGEVIYPGLPIERLQEKRKKETKKVRLLFVGVWFERKGGRILLEAFRKVCELHSTMSLTILGQLPEDIKLTSESQITQKDFVSYKELQHHYRTHDVLVHVPPKIEGYGMTVPEAMSYGVIPVVSDVCVLPEFVDHNINGVIVKRNSSEDLEKALVSLITNPRLRKKLSQGAQKKFNENFALPIFQKKLKSIFHEAVQ